MASEIAADRIRSLIARAAESPEAATEFISQHAGAVADLLDQSLEILRSIETLIQKGDAEGMLKTLEAMQREAVAINTQAQ